MKTEKKKPTKIDVAIARAEDRLNKTETQIAELKIIKDFYTIQLNDLKNIKNDKSLL